MFSRRELEEWLDTRALATLARRLNRRGPLVLLLAAPAWFLGSEYLDRRWHQSLRPARCRVISSHVEGRIAVHKESGAGDREDYRGEYVEKTSLELEVEGVGPTRRVRQVVGYRFDPKDPMVPCWVAGENDAQVALLPKREWAERMKDNILSAAVPLVLGLAWMSLRRRAAV
jgi:hypothetical protein